MPAQLLRVSGGLENNPPEPDNARERLREAIAWVGVAEHAVTRAEQTRTKVHSQVFAAMRTLDIAKDALRQAEANGQQNRVAVLMGEAETGPALSDLRKACDLAETVLAGTKADQDLLDDEIRLRGQTLDFAKIARDGAVADVLRPAANALLQRIEDAQATVAALKGALRALPLDVLPAYWDSQQNHPEDATLNAKWRDIVAALATNADAAIPQETQQ